MRELLKVNFFEKILMTNKINPLLLKKVFYLSWRSLKNYLIILKML